MKKFVKPRASPITAKNFSDCNGKVQDLYIHTQLIYPVIYIYKLFGGQNGGPGPVDGCVSTKPPQ